MAMNIWDWIAIAMVVVFVTAVLGIYRSVKSSHKHSDFLTAVAHLRKAIDREDAVVTSCKLELLLDHSKHVHRCRYRQRTPEQTPADKILYSDVIADANALIDRSIMRGRWRKIQSAGTNEQKRKALLDFIQDKRAAQWIEQSGTETSIEALHLELQLLVLKWLANELEISADNAYTLFQEYCQYRSILQDAAEADLCWNTLVAHQIAWPKLKYLANLGLPPSDEIFGYAADVVADDDFVSAKVLAAHYANGSFVQKLIEPLMDSIAQIITDGNRSLGLH